MNEGTRRGREGCKGEFGAMRARGARGIKSAAQPWPKVETHEHWHEADRRALALMRLIVEKIDADPSLLQVGIENMKRWREQRDGYQPRCLDQWEEWFARGEPWERIRARLLEASDEGQRLRKSHPFAGVLTDDERESVYDFDCEQVRRDYTARTGRYWPDSGTPQPDPHE